MGGKLARKPCFFKILIGEDFTERLGIPRKFIRKFGEDVSSVAVLMVRDANIWDIGLSKDADGRVWLQNGWEEFVEYYRLYEGKILFFRYDGDSCFCVLILVMSEIQYPRYPKNYEEENLDKGKLVDKGERQEENCMEFLAEFPTRTYSQKVIDGCDNQRTAKASTDNTPLQRHSCQPFNKPSNGDKTCSEMLPSKPAIVATYKRKKTEDNGKLRTLAAGNAFKPVQQNNPQGNAFNFENEVGVAPNHSSTPDRMNDNHQKSTKNTKNVLSFAPFSSRYVDLQLVNGSEQTETPRNDTESPCPKPKYGNGEISSPEQENQIGGYTSSTEDEVSEVTANIRARSKVSVSKRKSVVNEEKCRVIYGHQFQSENPFFTVIMESWHLCKGPSLYVPFSFSIRHLDEEKQNVRLCVSDGRNWNVRFIYRRGRARISKGWAAFARDNKLEEGDCCVFELTETNNIEMKVSIHVVEISYQYSGFSFTIASYFLLISLI